MQFMIGYDDDQLGPLEEANENCDPDAREVENALLTSAIEEFNHKYQKEVSRYLKCTLLNNLSTCVTQASSQYDSVALCGRFYL